MTVVNVNIHSTQTCYFYLESTQQHAFTFRSTQKCSIPTLGMSTKNIFLFPFKPYHCSHCQNTPISFCYLSLNIHCPKKLGALVQKTERRERKKSVEPKSSQKFKREKYPSRSNIRIRLPPFIPHHCSHPHQLLHHTYPFHIYRSTHMHFLV